MLAVDIIIYLNAEGATKLWFFRILYNQDAKWYIKYNVSCICDLSAVLEKGNKKVNVYLLEEIKKWAENISWLFLTVPLKTEQMRTM